MEESENFKFQNDEYLLQMTLYSDDFIEFKITQNSPTAVAVIAKNSILKKSRIFLTLIQTN